MGYKGADFTAGHPNSEPRAPLDSRVGPHYLFPGEEEEEEKGLEKEEFSRVNLSPVDPVDEKAVPFSNTSKER